MSQIPPSPERPPKKVYIKTYGCQMNVYDSERMVGLLKPLGYEPVADPADVDLVILNTCHIREKAAEKVYSDLGRIKQHKVRKPEMKVAVAGCVAQAEGAEIQKRAPVVDLVFGPQAYHKLPEMVARAARGRGEILETDFAVEEKFDRLATREIDGYSAFVTIQEGCDKFCTFCVVPYTRGVEVSRSVDAIIAEIRSLAVQGLREVTLLGQNVNAWHCAPPAGQPGHTNGHTSSANWGLGELVAHVAKIDGIDRIRFMTSHPRDMNDGLIAAFGAEKKLMPYLHLPVQSGSDKILQAMNRGHTAAEYLDQIKRVRAVRPDIAISGDMIVGFPGETEADFEATMEVVREVGYASCFSFKYSRRPGTPGATMPLQVPEQDKSERLARLQALLESQKQEFNRAQLGKTLPVLFEKAGRNKGQLIGRTPYLQAVHAMATPDMIGQILPVEIIGLKPNSLDGRLAGEPKK